MESTKVSHLNTLKCCNVVVVDIFIETCRKQTSVTAPVINCSMHLSYFSPDHQEFGFALMAVAASATIAMGTSSSSDPGMDEQ